MARADEVIAGTATPGTAMTGAALTGAPMTDLAYGAVATPGWRELLARDHHPRDGSFVFTVTDALQRSRGKPLLLLHGVGNSGAIFGPIMPALAALGPIAAPTLSPELLPVGDATDESRRADAVATLVDWLAELHPPPWNLVGHSMGGVLVGLILRTRPQVVSRAVLLNAPLPGVTRRIRNGDTLDRTGRALLAMKALARITALGRPRLPGILRGPELLVVRNALRGFVHDPGALDAEVVSRAILWSRTRDGVDFLRLARDLPHWEREPYTGRRVAIVLGETDPLVPMSDLDRVIERYPNADVFLVPECGHFVHLERGGATIDIISEHFTPRTSLR